MKRDRDDLVASAETGEGVLCGTFWCAGHTDASKQCTVELQDTGMTHRNRIERAKRERRRGYANG